MNEQKGAREDTAHAGLTAQKETPGVGELLGEVTSRMQEVEARANLLPEKERQLQDKVEELARLQAGSDKGASANKDEVLKAIQAEIAQLRHDNELIKKAMKDEMENFRVLMANLTCLLPPAKTEGT